MVNGQKHIRMAIAYLQLAVKCLLNITEITTLSLYVFLLPLLQLILSMDSDGNFTLNFQLSLAWAMVSWLDVKCICIIPYAY